MNGMSFFQVRRHGNPNPNELAVLIRRAIISFYPGTTEDHRLNALHSASPGFYLSRAGGSEVIWARVFPEPLTDEILASLHEEARAMKISVLDFRPRVQNFLTFIFSPSLEPDILKQLKSFETSWAFYEYFFLQAENEEGLALRKYESVVAPEFTESPQKVAIRKPEFRDPSSIYQYSRLTPEELNTLIDLSLSLEQRAQGLDSGGSES